MKKATYFCFLIFYYYSNIKTVNANHFNQNNWNKYNIITYHNSGFKIKNYRSSYLHKINKIVSKKKTSINKIEHYLLKHINNYNINSIFMNIAKHHINLKNYDKALEYYDNIITFSDDEKQDIIFNKAYIYLCKKDYKKALELFKTITRINDNVKYYLSITYLFLDQYDNAFEILETVNENYENISDIKYFIIYSFFKQKKYLDLIKYYHKNIDNKYSNINKKVYFLLGISYFHTNDYSSSVKYLKLFKNDVPDLNIDDEIKDEYNMTDNEKILDINENENNTSIDDSNIYNENEDDIDISIDECVYNQQINKKIILLNENNNSLETKDLLTTNQENNMSIEKNIEENENHDINNDLSYGMDYDEDNQTYKDISIEDINNLYISYDFMKMRNYEMAIPHLEKLFEVNDSLLKQLIFYHMGICYYEINDYESALYAFEKASDFNNESDLIPFINYYKSCLYLAFNRYDEALDILKEIKSKYPEFEYINNINDKIAQICSKNNDYSFVIKYIESLDNISQKSKILYQRAALNKANEYFKNHQYFEAIEMYHKSLKYPINEDYSDHCYLFLGECFEAINNYEKAIDAYKKIKKTNKYSIIEYNLGYIYYNFHQYSLALKHFSKYAKITNNFSLNEETDIRMADCYAYLKNYNLAIKLYKPYKDDYCYFQLANIYKILKQYDNAIDYYVRISKEYPESQYKNDSIYENAEIYLNQHKYKKAIDLYDTLIKNDSKHIKAYFKRGKAYGYIKNNQKAANDYKYILDNHPSNEYAKDALIELLKIEKYDSKLYNETLEKYDAKIQNASIEAITYENIKDLITQKQYKNAISHLTKMIDRYSNSQYINVYYYTLGKLYYTIDKYQDAITYLIKVNKDNVIYYQKSLLLIGDIYFKDNKYDKAIECHTENLSISDDIKVKYKCLSELIKIYTLTNEYKNVIKFADERIQLGDILPYTVDKTRIIMANGYIELEEYDKALSECNKISKKSPVFQDTIYIKAKILYHQQDYKKSLDTLLTLKETVRDVSLIDKIFILIALNYIKMGLLFQAEVTLNSIIKQAKDQDIVKQAQQLMKEIQNKQNKTNIDKTNNIRITR